MRGWRLVPLQIPSPRSFGEHSSGSLPCLKEREEAHLWREETESHVVWSSPSSASGSEESLWRKNNRNVKRLWSKALIFWLLFSFLIHFLQSSIFTWMGLCSSDRSLQRHEITGWKKEPKTSGGSIYLEADVLNITKVSKWYNFSQDWFIWANTLLSLVVAQYIYHKHSWNWGLLRWTKTGTSVSSVSSPFITVIGSSIWGFSRLMPITVAKFSTFILFTLECSCTSNKNLKNKRSRNQMQDSMYQTERLISKQCWGDEPEGLCRIW